MSDNSPSTAETLVRTQMMREMPAHIREPAIRAGVRLGQVIDARDRFQGVTSGDVYCDGDIA